MVSGIKRRGELHARRAFLGRWWLIKLPPANRHRPPAGVAAVAPALVGTWGLPARKALVTKAAGRGGVRRRLNRADFGCVREYGWGGVL